MSFADTFNLPTSREVNGKTYQLRRLSTEDYLSWVVELNKQRRDEGKQLIMDVPMPPQPKLDAMLQVSRTECTLDTIAALMGSPEVQSRVLRMTAKNAGITEENELKAFMSAAGPRQNERDAYRVSGLFTSEQYLLYFPDEMPPADSGTVAVALGMLTKEDTDRLIAILSDKTLNPIIMRNSIRGLLAKNDAKTPDPNAQSPDQPAGA